MQRAMECYAAWGAQGADELYATGGDEGIGNAKKALNGHFSGLFACRFGPMVPEFGIAFAGDLGVVDGQWESQR